MFGCIEVGDLENWRPDLENIRLNWLLSAGSSAACLVLIIVMNVLTFYLKT